MMVVFDAKRVRRLTDGLGGGGGGGAYSVVKGPFVDGQPSVLPSAREEEGKDLCSVVRPFYFRLLKREFDKRQLPSFKNIWRVILFG